MHTVSYVNTFAFRFPGTCTYTIPVYDLRYNRAHSHNHKQEVFTFFHPHLEKSAIYASYCDIYLWATRPMAIVFGMSAPFLSALIFNQTQMYPLAGS